MAQEFLLCFWRGLDVETRDTFLGVMTESQFPSVVLAKLFKDVFADFTVYFKSNEGHLGFLSLVVYFLSTIILKNYKKISAKGPLQFEVQRNFQPPTPHHPPPIQINQ